MAKKSKIARNEQRKVIVDRYAAKRLELKKALDDPAGTDESREAARVGLQKLPRNASPVRVRGRDAVDVAMVTTYGPASLRRMAVWTDEVPDDAELAVEPTSTAL